MRANVSHWLLMGGTLTTRPGPGSEAASTARQSVERMISGRELAGHAVGCLRVRPCGRLQSPAPVNFGFCPGGDGWLVVV